MNNLWILNGNANNNDNMDDKCLFISLSQHFSFFPRFFLVKVAFPIYVESKLSTHWLIGSNYYAIARSLILLGPCSQAISFALPLYDPAVVKSEQK